MSTLLTHNEYSVIAKNLTFSVNPFVNGKFSKPLSGNTMETINPATGDVLLPLLLLNKPLIVESGHACILTSANKLLLS